MLPHFLYQQLHTDANKKMKWWCLCQHTAKVKGHNRWPFLLQLEWNLNSYNYICTIRKINIIAVARWTTFLFMLLMLVLFGYINIWVGSIPAGNEKKNYILFRYSGVNYCSGCLFKMAFYPEDTRWVLCVLYNIVSHLWHFFINCNAQCVYII